MAYNAGLGQQHRLYAIRNTTLGGHVHSSGLRRWALVPVIFWLACATGAALAQVGVLEFKLKTGAERYIQRPPIGIVQQVVPKDDFDRVSPFKPPNKVRTSQVPTSPTECDALSRALLDAKRRGLASPTLSFTSKCMTDWTERLRVPAPGKMEAALSRTIGLLVDADGSPFCAGFRVAAGAIRTAKHCFYDRETGQRLWEPGTVSFQLSAGDLRVALSQDMPQDVAPYSAAEDSLVLLVPDLEKEPMPPISPSREVKVGEKLLLIGVSEHFSEKVRFLSDGDTEGCFVALKDANCFYHNCSAEEGFSGAPIFLPGTDESGALQIVGMHLEGVGTPGTTCQAPGLRGHGNTALIIDK